MVSISKCFLQSKLSKQVSNIYCRILSDDDEIELQKIEPCSSSLEKKMYSL